MPVFEGICHTDGCSRHGRVVQYLLSSYLKEDKPCPECGFKVSRIVSAPNVVWAKPLGWYQGNTGDGHVVHGEYPDGTKYQKMITTRQEQLEHCRMNRLADPMEIDRRGAMDDKGVDESGRLHVWSNTPAALSSSNVDDSWI